MRPIDAARRYADRGLHVLPIELGGKKPKTEHGVTDASSDADQIHQWWQRWPAANVAIAVDRGLEFRWGVLDIDPRNGGDASLFALEEKHGPLPMTTTARTGGGGEHRLFRLPRNLVKREKFVRGVEFLGRGKYILVAPSIHPSGNRYAWINRAPIADAPEWLINLSRRPKQPQSTPLLDRVHDASILVRARKYLAACPGAISGSGGHNHTFSIAQKLVRGFGLDTRTALSLMSEWNARCEPPWSERELAHKITSAARDGQMQPGSLLERRSA